MTIVCIGGGYSTLCFIEELRRIGQNRPPSTEDSSNSINIFRDKIIVYSVEEFCNRPAVFFRLKFPLKDSIEYGLKDETYYEKIGVELRRLHVRRIDTREKIVHDEKGGSQPYSVLLVATGGIPRTMFPRIEVDTATTTGNNVLSALPADASSSSSSLLVSEEEQPSFLPFSPLVLLRSMHPDLNQPIRNVFSVRNRAEVEYLHQQIQSVLTAQQPSESPSPLVPVRKRVVIVGGGALALDLVSSMLEGGVPGLLITLLVRRGTIGVPLVNETGAQLLLNEARVHGNNRLQLILEDEIHTMHVSKSAVGALTYDLVSLLTRQGVLLADVLALVYALGVEPNSACAADSGLAVGPNHGLAVNLHMQCLSEGNDVVEGVFSCGDVAEIIDPMASLAEGRPVSAVWRNWSCARETAVACARSVAQQFDPVPVEEDDTPESDVMAAEWLVFSQSLKLFSYHIYCAGDYLRTASSPEGTWQQSASSSAVTSFRVRVFEQTATAHQYIRLVIVQGRTADAAEPLSVLVGALVMGRTATDHRLGMNLHRCIKMFRRIDMTASLTADSDAAAWTAYNWEAFVKAHRKSEPDALVHAWIRQACKPNH